MKKHTQKKKIQKSKSRELLIRYYYRIFDQFRKLFTIFIFHDQKMDHDVDQCVPCDTKIRNAGISRDLHVLSQQGRVFLNVSNVLLFPRPNYVPMFHRVITRFAVFRFFENCDSSILKNFTCKGKICISHLWCDSRAIFSNLLE